MSGFNPRPKKRGRFYIPVMRSANGHPPQQGGNGFAQKKIANAKSRVSKLDTWGCSIQPGKFFGRMLSENSYFVLYGSWRGDAVNIHREEDRDGDPVASMYLTPSGGWWLKPLVFKPDAQGLDRLKANFVEFVQGHEDLKNL